jgi:predicted transcriptional regulator of viral defense system
VKERFKKYIKDRYDLFDPTLPKQILNKNNWRLIDNVGEKTILNLIKY